MDQEIDLRPYMLVLLKRWRLILSCVIGLMIIGIVIPVAAQQRRSASADIMIVPVSSQVTLDPRFQTTSGSQATTPAAQRQALIGLATSHAVAEKVFEAVGAAPGGSEADPIQALIDQVQVSSSSDLLKITVSDPDPARAVKIADAWGQAYERLVADVYTRSQFRSDLLASELTAAQQRYDGAQQSLETFLGSGEIIQMQSQIAQLNGLLGGSREAQQLLYTDYLSRTHQLDLILEDAQTLRDQANASGASSFSDSFAALLLQARAVGGAATTFQLSASDIGSVDAASGSALANLDRLIRVISQRRDELRAQADEIASAIADDKDTAMGMDSATRNRYINQLATLNRSYEQLRAQQDILTQQRDLARDTLILLQRKRDEQEIARSSPQIEVRFVSTSLDPKPSVVARAALSGIAAGVVGLVLGVMLALLLDVLLPAVRRLTQPAPAQPAPRSDRPADRPMTGD
ncbi:hypothetical protein K2Z83_24170 [Oscillochloris sp. ZM17-4]|uniref:Wzz/FepE/Etk N-terminal domain-containing protein n=1 Tax=Oscillochloris sp. ZM17-4 TaxID=2866714 RepID=UPI001C73992D|nr:Wzz/FepE/Etk N-terminal domain-containing protein [Oscillochloris sp. ZM17-4]MBX0330757.1 hypothetical protein [Oscillochloris sp. ZM17-4]